jgi:transposase
MRKIKNTHPDWATQFKKPGTELKLINGRYYLYGVKSVYDKTLGRSKKVSLGILGSISQEKGFVPSQKNELKLKSKGFVANDQIISQEYGLSKWLIDTLQSEGLLDDLKKHFPDLWQFVVFMVYCRVAYKSPLKNIPFYLEQSDILDLIGWNGNLYDQKISDLLFELGSRQKSIHEFIKPKDNTRKTVLMDATDVILQSNHIPLAQKGYNANLDFQSQFVLLYLYDAVSLKPLYFRILPGNIREITALQNTIKISGMEHCIYIADKGFFSETNVVELEKLEMQFIIPLKRNNNLIPYSTLNNIEQTDNYFDFAKRFIFFADTVNNGNRKVNLFLDGKLKEQEKTDYLTRIQSLPESFSKTKFNDKVKAMGTLSLIHNTDLTPKEVFYEYKTRGEIEQFFDHLKNTLEASTSFMQREESLNGWMFVNHLSMHVVYKLFDILKHTTLNKKQKLIHKYSINDAIENLKSIKKIKYSHDKFVIAEINKATKALISLMNINIT